MILPLAKCSKLFRHCKTSMVRMCCTTGEHSRRIAERDTQDEVGIHSVHVAPFSHVSRFTRHGLWCWWNFSASC